jgi:long-chain acyl-CoA synthetase
MVKHLFLTGGTGFIGSRLLKLWLDRTEARITLLMHNHTGITAERQYRRLLGAYPAESREAMTERVHLVHGDLVAPNLGLNQDDQDAITSKVTHIVHAGARLRFDLALDQARQANTAGTAKVLDLARRCQHLERFDYLGTAYIASRCSGIVREDAIHDGLEHNNSYERSKYEAELLVRKAMDEIPATVLRPSIVTCDMETGYAPSTSAFYRLLLAVASGALEVLPGRAETRLDMVPVSYVVKAAFEIGRRSNLAGQCFHLSAGVENLISLGELRDLACASFGCRGLEILSPEEYSHWAADVCKAVPAMRSFLDELKLYMPYLSDHPIFDNTNTRQALADTDVRLVTVTKYFDSVAAYVRRSLATTSTQRSKNL